MASLIWTDARAARRLLPGLALAGAAGSVVGARLTGLVGTNAGQVAATACLGLALVTGGWIARDGRLPNASRMLLGAIGGALTGALILTALGPVTLAAYVLFGLVIGMALTPGRYSRGVLGEVAQSLPTAVGFVSAGVVAGILLNTAAISSLTAGGQAAILGALLGLGLGVGELTRGLLIARSSAPAWIETVRDECSAETRPILEAALSAHSRVVDGIVRASWLDSWERRESLALGSDLLAATARATRAADTGLRAALSLGQNAGDLEAHAELKKARVHILESLDEQIKDARRTAAKHAASLARLAVAVTERSVAFTLGQVELETRAEILEERVLAGTSWAVNS